MRKVMKHCLLKLSGVRLPMFFDLAREGEFLEARTATRVLRASCVFLRDDCALAPPLLAGPLPIEIVLILFKN